MAVDLEGISLGKTHNTGEDLVYSYGGILP